MTDSVTNSQLSKLNFSDYLNNIQQSNTVLVVLDKNAEFDQQLAAASLYLSLQNTGKRVSLLAPEEIKNPTISGLDQLKTKIGFKNLVISFDYVETAVNNVSYHIDDQDKKFYLTIKPQSGHDPLNKDLIKAEYAGAEADLIVTFGVKNLNDLEQLHVGYEELYKNSPILIFNDYKPSYNGWFVDVSKVSSNCEAVFSLIKALDYKVDAEAATNLLAGIQFETNNFIDPRASANTFEAVADLIRLGAQRKAGSFSLKKQDKEISILNKDEKNSAKKEQEIKEDQNLKPKTPRIRPSGLKK